MKVILILATLIGICGGLWLWTTSGGAPQSAAKAPNNTQAPSAPSVLRTHEAATQQVASVDPADEGYQQFIESPPASLRDLPLPSPLNLTDDGRLIVDAQVRLLFEHFLSALGEETLPQVMLRIQHQLAYQLDGDALTEAEALLAAYIQYRNHQDTIRQDYQALATNGQFDLPTLREMKQAERQARQQLFTEAQSHALFGNDDAIDQVMLERLSILSDSSLTPEQRQHQLQQVSDRLAALAGNTAQQALQRVLETDENLNANAEKKNSLAQSRTDQFGPDVAQRLAARDETRAQWQARVTEYRLQLQPLLSSGPLDQLLLTRLRHYHFSGPELVRIAALDKMELGI